MAGRGGFGLLVPRYIYLASRMQGSLDERFLLSLILEVNICGWLWKGGR